VTSQSRARAALARRYAYLRDKLANFDDRPESGARRFVEAEVAALEYVLERWGRLVGLVAYPDGATPGPETDGREDDSTNKRGE